MYRNISQAQPFDRSMKNGFRCVKHVEEGQISESVFEPFERAQSVDYYHVKPVSDAVFESYKHLFDYDKQALDSVVEESDDSKKYWIKEKVTFTPAYGEEKMIAYVFLPKGYPPPYQTILYWPGGGSSSGENVEVEIKYLDFFLKNGRALVYPILEGIYDRWVEDEDRPSHYSHRYTEDLIKDVKDHRRTIDYLETRPDIDVSKLGFYGFSWGACMGGIIPAVEDRIKAQVLVLGGIFPGEEPYPEAAQISYLPRVNIPSLFLSGRYDLSMPYMTKVKPVFDLLGTPDEDKDLILCDSDHFIPRNTVIKESHQWFDKYLGSVDKRIP